MLFMIYHHNGHGVDLPSKPTQEPHARRRSSILLLSADASVSLWHLKPQEVDTQNALEPRRNRPQGHGSPTSSKNQSRTTPLRGCGAASNRRHGLG
jgi:hypothetical protein